MPGTVLVVVQPFNRGSSPITSDAYIEAKDNSVDKWCSRALVGSSDWPGMSGTQQPIGGPVGFPVTDKLYRQSSRRQVIIHARSSPASGSTSTAVRNASFVLPLRRLHERANC